MDQNPTPAPAPAPTPEQPPVATPTSTVTPAAVDPGKTLGIVSLILPFVGFGLVGLILGIVARKKSAAVGIKNGFALAGIILGAISTFFGIIGFALIVGGIGSLASKCAELGNGTHTVDGVTYTCGTGSTTN